MNLEQITLQVVEIARKSGDNIVHRLHNRDSLDIQIKGEHDFVTAVDRESELFIVEQLKSILPEASFLAEEGTVKQQEAEYTWIIDPLDGTTNFIHKLPLFSVSIALMRAEQLIAGVIYEPNLKECFYAWKEGGAFLNAKPVCVSKCSVLNDALLATGFPYYDYGKLPAYMEFLAFTMKATRGIRRLGSAALDLAWVACGRFDAFYEYGLKPWDVAAGALIVEEAGGKVTNFSNGCDFLFTQEIIASNSLIHNELAENISVYFNKH